MDAVRKCLLAGYSVLQIVVLVDRQQGGLEKIKAEVSPDVPVTAIFTKQEIYIRWEEFQKSCAAVSRI
jgi:orotate phosphoribosyltransferase